jgi:hypothetical protein
LGVLKILLNWCGILNLIVNTIKVTGAGQPIGKSSEPKNSFLVFSPAAISQVRAILTEHAQVFNIACAKL